jgi:uncharacterized membrane protein
MWISPVVASCGIMRVLTEGNWHMGNRGQEPIEERHVGQRHLERLVMLSDGVFAIAITLSAIELKPDGHPGLPLWDAWSRPLLLYFLSFLLIGMVWFHHRRIVSHLRDVDATGTALNLLLLSLVALLPVVVRYALTEAAPDQSMLVYAVGISATYLCTALLWLHLAFIARLAPDLDRRVALGWLLQMVAAPLLMGAAVLYYAHLRYASLAVTLLGVGLIGAKRWLERLARVK